MVEVVALERREREREKAREVVEGRWRRAWVVVWGGGGGTGRESEARREEWALERGVSWEGGGGEEVDWHRGEEISDVIRLVAGGSGLSGD